MTTTTLRAGAFGFSRRVVLIGLIIAVSLVVAEAVLTLQRMAVVLACTTAVIALTVWRPRYGVYAVVLLVTVFEPAADDPFFVYGWMTQSNISTTTPLQAVIFTPLELLLLCAGAVVATRAVVTRTPLRGAPLFGPVLIFLALVTASIVWGSVRSGGRLYIALWETRNLYACGAMVLLMPNVFTSRGQIVRFVNILPWAILVLCAGIIVRRLTTLPEGVPLELAFAHESPLFVNMAIVLMLARLAWPASAGRRSVNLLIPIFIWAVALTERRSGWICLDVALILLAILVFRIRRRLFWFVVLPTLILYAGYVAAFWNASGPAAQPARAVRSISDPDARDAASNSYRVLETINVRVNIHSQPITGLGIGQPYTFFIPLPDLSWWTFWHYVPHNGVLWVWLKAGVFGFAAFLTLIGAGIVRGLQLLKRESKNDTAPVLVTLVATVIMVSVYAYVDVALMNVRAMLLLGFALGAIAAWNQTEHTHPPDSVL